MSKLAEELWEKYAYGHSGIVARGNFESALHEYGTEVRRRDAEVCRGIAEDHWPGLDAGASEKCAAAIAKEPLP